MMRMLAIVERELRKFFRSPALMMSSMVLPLAQLLILGNAFGGKITNAVVGVIDHDHGEQALQLHEAFNAIRVNKRTFTTIPFDNERKAVDEVRNGRLSAAVIIPKDYSRRMLRGDDPQIGLVVDNSDQFVSNSVEQEMQSVVDALNQPAVGSRITKGASLEVVELYPYISYMKFLLSGAITLAMFVSVMIGGGMLYIDDKARGVHEGYLVTPITKLELVMGLNFAGAFKAILAGVVLTVLGSLMAGLGTFLNPITALELLLVIIFTSVAFNGMMFLMMVRVDDPLVPRAMFGILNTLLYFPSGAIYPVSAFPPWLRWIATIDPFTYAVNGLQSALLKHASFGAIWMDLVVLFIFGAASLLIATPMFKRTL